MRKSCHPLRRGAAWMYRAFLWGGWLTGEVSVAQDQRRQ